MSRSKIKLSEETLVEYKNAFNVFDPKETGKISVLNVTQLMRKVGLMPSELEVEELIHEVDRDQNALSEGINFSQFCEIASRKYNDVYTESDIIEAFRIFDVDNNGVVSASVLQNALSTMGENLTDEEIKTMLIAAKVDSEGNIKYEEFVHDIMALYQ